MSEGREWTSIGLGALALGVAWWQLGQATDAFEAGNTIALARDARDIADKIHGAGDDPVKLNSAYDRYGDYFAQAGYLYGQGAIPEAVWERIASDFCRFYQAQSFRDWFARNSIKAIHISMLYPGFRFANKDCDNAKP